MTSQGKLRRAIRELETEADATRQQKAIVAAVLETLEDTIHGQALPRGEESVALDALKQRRASIEARIHAGAVHIHQKLVELEATGVLVGKDGQRSVDVVQDRVTGRDTLGVKIE